MEGGRRVRAMVPVPGRVAEVGKGEGMDLRDGGEVLLEGG